MNYSRGSEWRQWDLHIHSPASFHWNGEHFGEDATRNTALVDAMIQSLNNATPAVFALMDYWTFEGWFHLKQHTTRPHEHTLQKTVFPGIELRLAAPMAKRLNAHVIFSNEINDQYLRDFQSALRLELIDQPLSNNGLIEYARAAGADKLRKHQYDKAAVLRDDDLALQVGREIAEINCDSYKRAIAQVPQGLALGFMPFSTNDGLSELEWSEHYAYAIGLFKSSLIFETRIPDQWAAFAGVKTAANSQWFDAFQAALDDTPRLAISGSDAHRFTSHSKNLNERGYGAFPHNKITWIKADPTWRGLLQAVKEPAKRSFIGELPPKLDRVQKNKTFYIDQISIEKAKDSSLDDTWLDGCQISLNPDLVAIIGNKGSGKSALADIIALLGNSQQKEYFSFLRKDRFRGKAGDPAKQFIGRLTWLAGDPCERLLSEDPPSEKVELVRYIPQGRFEALCNDHVSGRSTAFERELREVIFSHTDPTLRIDALDFDQLIDAQESSIRAQLQDLRNGLHTLNETISNMEEQLRPDVRRTLEDALHLKRQQLFELTTTKPTEISQPTTEPTEEQSRATNRLEQINQLLKQMDENDASRTETRHIISKRHYTVKRILERAALFEEQAHNFTTSIKEDLELLALDPTSIVSVKINRTRLFELQDQIDAQSRELLEQEERSKAARTILLNESTLITAKLNEPQQRYQKYLLELKTWEASIREIEGSAIEPDSKKGIERRLDQISQLPERLTEKRVERDLLARQIHQVLARQRELRELLFKPLQDLIEDNSLIREDYRLRFRASLQGSTETFVPNLFDMVKRTAGPLRGEDENWTHFRSIFESADLSSSEEASRLANSIMDLLEEAAGKSPPGISTILKKGKNAVEVYDYIFGLSYIEPKYTLLFQDTDIERLSPGQRGALLLIFYLLVDKRRNPIILDQPEENLDNETVVSLLVPVINEAKKNRQIVMVTHNPNLAVVCDAEQVIYASFDRSAGSKITYQCGSIEDGTINRRVVDVLEGTKRAFTNRSDKYH